MYILLKKDNTYTQSNWAQMSHKSKSTLINTAKYLYDAEKIRTHNNFN